MILKRNINITMMDIIDAVDKDPFSTPCRPGIINIYKHRESRKEFVNDLSDECSQELLEILERVSKYFLEVDHIIPQGEHDDDPFGRMLKGFVLPQMEEFANRCSGLVSEVSVLGTYNSQFERIDLWNPGQYEEVVAVHERMHAIHHLLPDANGRHWKQFSKVDSCHKELLAQLFTHRYFRYRDARLLDLMEKLSKRQRYIYKTFWAFIEFPDHLCMELYWRIRECAETRDLLKRIFGDVLNPGICPVCRRDNLPCPGCSSGQGDVPVPHSVSFYRTERTRTTRRRPAHVISFIPDHHHKDLESCLVSGKLYGRNRNSCREVSAGDLGFLLDEDSETIVGIIECLDSWNEGAGHVDFGYLPFRVQERWENGVPLSCFRTHLKIKRRQRPIQPLHHESDCLVFLAAIDAYRRVAGRVEHALR